MASTNQLIESAVRRLVADVPALEKLKLVVGLELKGRGDVQVYRVELPGPKVAKGFADDGRLQVSIARSHFNELAADGRPKHWREAYEAGHVRVEGDTQIQRLIGQVIAHQEARSKLKKAR